MGKFRPILAGERTAAKLLDISLSEFRDCVATGALPGPAVFIADKHPRWSVADLEAIASGQAVEEVFVW